MLIAINVFVVLYLFARNTIKKEPYKNRLENIFGIINQYLKIYGTSRLYDNLHILLTITKKCMPYLFITIFIWSFLPQNIQNSLFLIFYPIFVIVLLLNFSIKWILFHKKTLKEICFNFPVLTLLFAPSIFYLFDKIFNISSLHTVTSFFDLGILKIQVIWLLIIIFVFYVGGFLIAIPIYCFIYSLIYLTMFLIKNIHKFLNENILDAIVGIIWIVISIMKAF